MKSNTVLSRYCLKRPATAGTVQDLESLYRMPRMNSSAEKYPETFESHVDLLAEICRSRIPHTEPLSKSRNGTICSRLRGASQPWPLTLTANGARFSKVTVPLHVLCFRNVGLSRSLMV